MLDHKKINLNNINVYKKKRLIQLIYNDYFKKIKKFIYKKNNKKILEIGSGCGNIKKIIKNCITSDQFKNGGIDRIENAYKINFKNNLISNIVFIDVFHHIKFPILALKEFHRVLSNKGRIIMIEPAMGLIPRIIYKIFHYEPNGFNLKINYKKFSKKIPSTKSYFAAQSIPWRLFYLKELNLKKNYKIKLIKPFSDFAYLFSGGYSYHSLYPSFLYSLLKLIDKFFTYVSANIFSARMLIVLEKNNSKFKL